MFVYANGLTVPPPKKRNTTGSLEKLGFPYCFLWKQTSRNFGCLKPIMAFPRKPGVCPSKKSPRLRMWWSLPALLWWSDLGLLFGVLGVGSLQKRFSGFFQGPTSTFTCTNCIPGRGWMHLTYIICTPMK